jgi:hypothetical protein
VYSDQTVVALLHSGNEVRTVRDTDFVSFCLLTKKYLIEEDRESICVVRKCVIFKDGGLSALVSDF